MDTKTVHITSVVGDQAFFIGTISTEYLNVSLDFDTELDASNGDIFPESEFLETVGAYCIES